MTAPPVPRYQQPEPELRRLSDDELYARLATTETTSWRHHHVQVELQRRANGRTGRRAWIAIWMSGVALAISLAALLFDLLLRDAGGD